MELWDAYDEKLNKIEGVTLIRGETIPEGMFHLVSEIFVRHVDGEILLMQRDLKKHFGGMWEATAGGSAIQGDSALLCAKRELYEETGIICNDLIELGIVVSKKHKTIYVEFLAIVDCDKNNITLQEGETIAFKWISQDDLFKMNKEELLTHRVFEFFKR